MRSRAMAVGPAEQMQEHTHSTKRQVPGLSMLKIRFTDEAKREDGLRLIMSHGPVRFTGTRGVYQVPPYILRLLLKADIPYQQMDL